MLTIVAFALMSLDLSARGAILWKQTEATLVRNDGIGKDILRGVLKPENNASSDTLYFKFRVSPLSNALTETTNSYLAGMVFYLGDEPHLGVGNARKSWGYSAFGVAGKGPDNDVQGEYNLNSATPELGKKFEYVGRGDNTIVFKVQYIPGQNARITAWLSPELALGATENNQQKSLVTQFEADATFDVIRLVHQGGGDGWQFSNIAVATSFEDLLEPKFWQRFWFRSSIVAGLFILVIFAARLSERRRFHRRIELLERERVIANERERIARDIHDELGAELAQIGLLADIGCRGEGRSTETDQDFARIAERARNVVATLDEIVWAVDPRNDNLSRLADYLCQMADECFDGSPLRLRKDVPTQFPAFPVRAEVRHDLTLATKEALANVLKHSGASEAWLRIAWNEPELVISVEDNGIGFDISMGERGNGLDNQRLRLERIGGVVEMGSTPGSGTRVTFRARLNHRN